MAYIFKALIIQSRWLEAFHEGMGAKSNLLQPRVTKSPYCLHLSSPKSTRSRTLILSYRGFLTWYKNYRLLQFGHPTGALSGTLDERKS